MIITRGVGFFLNLLLVFIFGKIIDRFIWIAIKMQNYKEEMEMILDIVDEGVMIHSDKHSGIRF